MTDTEITTTPEAVPYPSVDPLEVLGKTIGEEHWYCRDTYWKTQHGEYVKIRHLKDTHLANLIAWVTHHPHRYDDDRMLQLLGKEAQLRGLSPAFLDRAFLPYRREEKWLLTVDLNRLDQVVG